MTDDSAFKKQVRARMAETGENYTTARRMVIAGRDPGQPPVVVRVYLNPHVDLELTAEAGRAYAAADEQGRRELAGRLLADQIEVAGSGEARVAAGSKIVTDQELRAERRLRRTLRCSGASIGRSGCRRWRSSGEHASWRLSRTVAPRGSGKPSTMRRTGSPPVCISTVL